MDFFRGFGVRMIIGVDLAVDSNGEFLWVYRAEARDEYKILGVGFLNFEATYGHEFNIKSDKKDTRK